MKVQSSAGASRSHVNRIGRPRGRRGPIRWALVSLAMAALGLVASQSAVEVSPPVLLHEGGQAAPVDAAFAVKNPTDAALLVRISLSDWHYLADGSPNYLEAGSLPRSLAPFVTFNPSEVLLEPGATGEVRYTVELPATAEPGTYWGVLFMTAEDPDPEPGFTLARFSVRVGHVVYVNVPPLAPDGQIVGIFGEPPTDSADAYALHIQYANTGNVVQRLDGYVELRDAQGEILFHEELPPQVSLPGDVVGRTFSVYGPLEPGNYTALVVYNYGDETIDVAADYPFALAEALLDPSETAEEGP
jgi:hypothetical protein